MGNALLTIILASSVLYELAGPACAKLSLYLSGSYSDKLEDITVIPSGEETRNSVEELIFRIKQIQKTLPKHEEVSEDEEAFTKPPWNSIIMTKAVQNKELAKIR